MKTVELKVTRIGNSRGVRLPASGEDWSEWDALASNGIGDTPRATRQPSRPSPVVRRPSHES